MTIRFRNPWIDPRVLDVRPADAEVYLRNHGWQEAESNSAQWKRFLAPASGAREAVLLPSATTDESLVHLLVECVGKVAAWEGRYAGELLNELLAGSTDVPSNGPASHTGARH
ncbi:MAG: hypothetical protein J0I06_11470 [Planctomycetes bacterium]|nr:hypothetical protein [Planctomycetota bacterium]